MVSSQIHTHSHSTEHHSNCRWSWLWLGCFHDHFDRTDVVNVWNVSPLTGDLKIPFLCFTINSKWSICISQPLTGYMLTLVATAELWLDDHRMFEKHRWRRDNRKFHSLSDFFKIQHIDKYKHVFTWSFLEHTDYYWLVTNSICADEKQFSKLWRRWNHAGGSVTRTAVCVVWSLILNRCLVICKSDRVRTSCYTLTCNQTWRHVSVMLLLCVASSKNIL